MRLLFVAGGLAVGLAAVGFALLADCMQEEFGRILQVSPFIPLALTPLGFAGLRWATRRYFPLSGGSGIPQAIAARAMTDETARHRLVSLRVAAGKMLLTGLGLLVGGSLGREGPTVQIGASLMYAVGHISPRRQRGLILAGAAAGVAAAFNTPLAGIVFGIEEMARSFESKTSGLVLSTVIAAGLVSLALSGNYDYFGHTGLMVNGLHGWLAVPICGITGGLCGGLFSRVVVAASGPWPGKAGRWIKSHPILLAGLCGLGVALAGLASGNTTYGTGYAQVVHLLTGDQPIPEGFGALKLAATLLTSLSGIPGGIFAPSLAVGAGLGQNLAGLLPLVPLPLLVVLGMVGYFAGVVQAPITACVIMMEMTDDHAMLLPLMLTALIAHMVSRRVCQEGIYHALARNFLPLDQRH